MAPHSQPGSAAQQTPSTDGEIVVAIPHVQLVRTVIGSSADEVGRLPRLGLARIRISDLAEVAARFAPAVAARRRSSPTAAVAWASGDDLDMVLNGLRTHIADAWAGWFPVLGKNRSLPLGGEGWPYIVPKSSAALPVVTDGADTPYAGLPADVAGDGGKGRVVGLLDTPVTAWMAGEIGASGAAVLPGQAEYDFRAGHGTFTAGLVRQYAPEAEVRIRGLLTGPESTATSWDFAKSLLDLVGADPAPAVDFVVLPLGCVTGDGEPPLVIQRAVELVRDRVVIVAAAGNHGDLTTAQMRGSGVTRVTPMWPAALDGVVAVGAEQPDGPPSGFTPRVPWVDFLAPGEDLSSAYLTGPVSLPDLDPDDDPDSAGSATTTATTTATATERFTGYARWSGTSMSAAVAAARLACVARGEERPHDVLDRVRGAGTSFLRPTTSW
jgi:hypothetical protein